MASVKEVLDFVTGLADSGRGVDYDGAWGQQCVDLPNWICGHYFGQPVWGNARDLLDSAERNGFEVHWQPTSAVPGPGACFVKDYVAGDGVNYGHTGVIISVDGDIAQTVEQNLVGNLYVGGPAGYATQRISKLVGWFYPPYADKGAAAPSGSASGNLGKVKDETGKMTVKVSLINVRSAPSLGAEVVATYGYGEVFHYDEVYINDGYVWVSYVGQSGNRRYVAAGEERNRQNVVPYGTFE